MHLDQSELTVIGKLLLQVDQYPEAKLVSSRFGFNYICIIIIVETIN